MIGCAAGGTRTTEPPVPSGVAYVRKAVLLPADAEDILAIEDAGERLGAYSAAAVGIRDVWLVPGPTFEWLMKKADLVRRRQQSKDP